MGIDKRLFFTGILTLIAASCKADSEAISTLSNKTEKAREVYEQTINHCDKISKENDLPLLDKRKLIELGVTRDEAVTAIYHLSVRNYYLCEKAALHEYSFLTNALKFAKKEPNDDNEKLYPSIKNLEYEAKYMKITLKKRDFFESAIKNQPYDFMNYIEKNGFSRY